MNLIELHAKAMAFMGGYFMDHGALPNTFFALDGKQHLHILIAPEYTKRRGFYKDLLRAYFIKHNVAAYGFAYEAWAAPYKTEECADDNFPKIMPRDHPDRVEVVGSGAVNADELLDASFRIARETGKKPRIGAPYMPPGLPFESKRISREGIFGLLEGLDAVTPEAREELGRAMYYALLVKPAYFPVIRVLTPAQYDGLRN